MSGLLSEQLHFVKGLDPVANAFAGTVYTQAVSMAGWERCLFDVYCGVGVTGTATLTVQACSDASGSNPTAIAFRYREILSTDIEGTLTLATTAGFTTTAGSSKHELLEVRAEDLAALGYGYVRLKSVEVVASPVLGGVAIILGEPRNRSAIAATVVV